MKLKLEVSLDDAWASEAAVRLPVEADMVRQVATHCRFIPLGGGACSIIDPNGNTIGKVVVE